MHPQWILCYLMWLFRLSYLASLKLRKSPCIPKGFSPDHHDGLHQLYSSVSGTSEHLWMFGLRLHLLQLRRDQCMGQHFEKIHLFRFMEKQSWRQNQWDAFFCSLLSNMWKHQTDTPLRWLSDVYLIHMAPQHNVTAVECLNSRVQWFNTEPKNDFKVT